MPPLLSEKAKKIKFYELIEQGLVQKWMKKFDSSVENFNKMQIMMLFKKIL